MEFEQRWRDLRDAAANLPEDVALRTPATDRTFDVVAVESDRVVVRYRDGGADRSLWRDQFAVLADRLAEGGELRLADLPVGVEPYVAVLSLLDGYAVEGGALREAEEGGEGSPFVLSAEAARTPPERVHDDALLLADALDRYDADDPDSLPTEPLTDLYVLLSDAERGAGGLRTEAGDALLDRVGPDGRLHGRFGTVTRTVRERRRPKDDETVLAALDELGIPHEWVLGVDPEKLDVVLSVTDLDPDDVLDVDEQVYVQKTATDETEKRARLDGLRDRLDALDEAEADRLREEIDDLEDRLAGLLG